MTPSPFDAEDRRLDHAIRAVAEAKSRRLGDHPSSEELVDYHLGLLTSDHSDRIQEHLSLCGECSQAVIDLAALSGPDTGEGKLAPAELDREWDRLQARLGGESRPGPPAARRRTSLLLLAASLVCILGLLAWNVILRRELREMHRPRADFAFADLVPEPRGASRGTEAPAQVHVGPEQDRVLFLLNLGDLREFSGYRIDLLGAGESVVWSKAGVPRTDDGRFVVEIPAEMLKAGIHRIELSGQDADQEIPLATYSFEIAPVASSAGDR